MTAATRPLILLVLVVGISAGCGSSNATRSATVTTTSTDAETTSARVSTTILKAAVRSAIHADRELSLYVLWHNRVPAWATRSTRGPALKALRIAAATRRNQGIRIKNLSGGYTVTVITLAASYATATAVIRSHQHVAPYKNGHRLGKAISENDDARIQLHRLGNSRRFVVWRLTPIQ